LGELESSKASLFEAQSDASMKDVALAKAQKDVELARLMGSSSSAEKERLLEEGKVRDYRRKGRDSNSNKQS
jgi:hypothetical protein